MELGICLGRDGQSNLEALYPSVGSDGVGESHAVFQDTEFQSLMGACGFHVGIETRTTRLLHK